MDAARTAAFQQLVPGASFRRDGRFGAAAARFKPKPKSPSLLPADASLSAPHLAPLDFFSEGRPSALDTRSEPVTDATSEGGGDSTAASGKGSPGASRQQERRRRAAEGDGDGEAAAPLGRRAALELRRQHFIKVAGADVPPPCADFTRLGQLYSIPEYLQRNLFDRGLRTPTPVQMQALPCLLSGRDLLAIAPTGSGKTLAFLLPMLVRLRKPRPKHGLRGVVLAHSKELAQQTERELHFLCKGKRWRLQTLQTNKSAVTRQDIIVSTPARLLSLVSDHQADLSKVLFCVFDEADRLFDEAHDSFLQAMNEVLARCTHPDRVLSVFSATMPEKAEDLLRRVLRDPCRVMIGTRAAACRDVEQSLVYCGKEQGKMEALRSMIRKGVQPPVLIFVDRIDRAKDLYLELRALGVSAAAIHSDRTPAQRDATVHDFRAGKVHMLVCTELLSRGVDIKGVGTVINYDFPTSVTSYVHRVGRTGRAGRRGCAVTLWTDDDQGDVLRKVGNVIRRAGSTTPEWMEHLPKTKGGRRRAKLPEHIPVRREAVSAIRRVKDAEERTRRWRQRQQQRQGKRKRPAADGGDSEGEGGAADGGAPKRKRPRRRSKGGPAD